MKTAMQEMIDWLKSQYNVCINLDKQHEADFLNGHISVAMRLHEKEKCQLQDAFSDGLEEDLVGFDNMRTPIQYFIDTYIDK